AADRIAPVAAGSEAAQVVVKDRAARIAGGTAFIEDRTALVAAEPAEQAVRGQVDAAFLNGSAHHGRRFCRRDVRRGHLVVLQRRGGIGGVGRLQGTDYTQQ